MIQLITPNLNPQIVQPNRQGGEYVIADWYGMCDAYVEQAFGFKYVADTAHDLWDKAKYKHSDRNLPSGVYVPIFFDWIGHDEDHVAIYKDGRVYSSPITHKASHDEYSSISAIERAYGCTYMGWFEDFNGKKVIQEGEDMATDKQIDDWISLFHQETYGMPPSDEVFNSWRPLLKNNFIDGSLSIMQGTNTNEGALKNTRASIDYKLTEMQTTISSLSTRPTNTEYAKVQAQLNDSLADIKKLQEQSTADTQLLNQGKPVFAWLTALINRLRG